MSLMWVLENKKMGVVAGVQRYLCHAYEGSFRNTRIVVLRSGEPFYKIEPLSLRLLKGLIQIHRGMKIDLKRKLILSILQNRHRKK